MKIIISYAILFLNLHPELKRNFLNIVYKFPILEEKLKHLKAEAEVLSTNGKQFWEIVLTDMAYWFLGRSKIQKLLTTMLSIIYPIERKIQNLIIISPASKASKISTTENQEQDLTPHARRIYYDLKKALAKRREEAM